MENKKTGSVFVWKSMPANMRFEKNTDDFITNTNKLSIEIPSFQNNNNNNNNNKTATTKTTTTTTNNNNYYFSDADNNNKKIKKNFTGFLCMSNKKEKNGFLKHNDNLRLFLNKEEKKRKTIKKNINNGSVHHNGTNTTKNNINDDSSLQFFSSDKKYKKVSHVILFFGDKWEKFLKKNYDKLELALKKDIVAVSRLSIQAISGIKFAYSGLLVASFYLLQEHDINKIEEINKRFDKYNYPNMYSLYSVN